MALCGWFPGLPALPLPGADRWPEGMETDFLVIGAGVAGLSAAIEAATAGRVLVLTKDRLSESATEYSQGGVAVALSDEDEVRLHEQDTLQAGAGLCDPRAVRALVEAGPRRIQRLIEWGAGFDSRGGRLTFSIEGAHSVNRVLHAGGDSTGREIARTLLQKARSIEAISFRSFSSVVELLVRDGEVCGAIAWNEQDRSLVPVHARAVLIATGGVGRIYRETTNPDVATGDGVAMAYRAGATIANMEMVQFHPTALFLEGAPRFLLSEAIRGEGAVLRNADMQRFMSRYHQAEELAPRDIVSRAIVSELGRLRKGPVYLDLTHLSDGFVRKRFPRIYRTCMLYGVDLEVEPVPVHPAAHYAMGGVATGFDGATTLPRLYAAGEAACNGVHGANRLASNSLLEGLVFGARAGEAMRQHAGDRVPQPPIPRHQAGSALPGNAIANLRHLAWKYAGITRSGQGLQEGLQQLDLLSTLFEKGLGRSSRHGFETDNMYQVIRLVARCALARQESRGGHYRTDFPDARQEYRGHSQIRRGQQVRFVRLGGRPSSEPPATA